MRKFCVSSSKKRQIAYYFFKPLKFLRMDSAAKTRYEKNQIKKEGYFMNKLFITIIALMLCAPSFAANRPNLKTQLADFIKANKEQVLQIAKNQYEYTYYEFPIEAKNCIAKSSPIGVVGVCLVTGLANEENAIAHFAVNVTSDYSGTGDKERKFSITLIDYEI